MREIIPRNAAFDFIGKGPIFLVLSAILVIGSLYVWIGGGSRHYGVDFLGGHEFLIKTTEKQSVEALREQLQGGGITDPTVQAFESGSNEYSVRLPSGEDAREARSKVTAVLDSTLQGKYEIIKSDFVGPTIGAELRKKALWAVSVGLIAILIYVAVRFEFAFALGAVVALFHDVIVSLGAYLVAGHTITMGTLAAALTIVGYSVNDTIIIFDRIREEIRKGPHESLSKLVNDSINQTLSRTITTQLLTTVSILALLIFGGGAIADLSFFLFAGMITGAYSTMYIASPVMIGWHKFRGGSEKV